MIVEVDTASPVPPYEQIRAQISELAESGQLAEGDRLPAIRQLAGDLGIAAGTVARAYHELEIAGIVISRVRHGTTIAPRRKPTRRQAGRRLVEAARTYAHAVAALEVTREEAVAAFDSQLAHLR